MNILSCEDMDDLIIQNVDSLLNTTKDIGGKPIEEILKMNALALVIKHISFGYAFYNIEDLRTVIAEMRSPYLKT